MTMRAHVELTTELVPYVLAASVRLDADGWVHVEPARGARARPKHQRDPLTELALVDATNGREVVRFMNRVGVMLAEPQLVYLLEPVRLWDLGGEVTMDLREPGPSVLDVRKARSRSYDGPTVRWRIEQSAGFVDVAQRLRDHTFRHLRGEPVAGAWLGSWQANQWVGAPGDVELRAMEQSRVSKNPSPRTDEVELWAWDVFRSSINVGLSVLAPRIDVTFDGHRRELAKYGVVAEHPRTTTLFPVLCGLLATLLRWHAEGARTGGGESMGDALRRCPQCRVDWWPGQRRRDATYCSAACAQAAASRAYRARKGADPPSGL